MGTKKKMTSLRGDQLLISGMVTESDVVSAFFRREGAKGGKMRTAKQTEARRRNIKVATAARLAKRKREAGGNV